MKTFLVAFASSTPNEIVYNNILIDSDFAHYHYINPLPVYLFFGAQQQVGKAYLRKVGKTLYGKLVLQDNTDYGNFYPHLPFDTHGNVAGLVLSPYAHYDENIKTLQQQLALPSYQKGVA